MCCCPETMANGWLRVIWARGSVILSLMESGMRRFGSKRAARLASLALLFPPFELVPTTTNLKRIRRRSCTGSGLTTHPICPPDTCDGPPLQPCNVRRHLVNEHSALLPIRSDPGPRAAGSAAGLAILTCRRPNTRLFTSFPHHRNVSLESTGTGHSALHSCGVTV